MSSQGQASQCALKYIKSRGGEKHVIWSPKLTKLKAVSRNALQRWRDGACPTRGVLFDDKQNTKRAYKNAQKDQKLLRERAHLQRMNECIDNFNISSFWRIWNKHRSESKLVASELKPDDFVNNFKSNFIQSSDNKAMVNRFLHCFMNCENSVNMVAFSVEQIVNACIQLHDSNCIDYNDLTVKHLRYAHPSIFVWLKELFNSMLSHSFVPEGFGKNIIIPITKNKLVSSQDVSNFRPIFIEPICTKLFEQCMVPVFEPFMSFHGNQFGFVPEGGGVTKLYLHLTQLLNILIQVEVVFMLHR
jgi:hypothetical protein